MWILSPGDLFADRYRILRELGSGGMSYVFAAEDVELDEKVALKLIRPDFVEEADFVERFKREVRIARQIQHPNIVRVLEFGSALVRDKRLYYLTMELLDGGDLALWMRERKDLALADILRIGLQTCDALAEAHRLGIVHRDIKPQNIFIEREGRVKLMDFGISRLPTLPSVTTGGQLVGTPKYMSPEQVHRKTEPDHRSDIYSLGIVLYELVTRRPPFEGSSAVDVALMHIQNAPPPPSQLDPKIPPELEEVILKCLEKEPARRFQSIAELRNELQSLPSAYHGQTLAELATDVLSMLPTARTSAVPRTAVAAGQPEPSTVAMETIRRKRWRIPYAAISLALAVVAVFVSVLLSRQETREPVIEVEKNAVERDSPSLSTVPEERDLPRPKTETPPLEQASPPPRRKTEVETKTVEGELAIDSRPSGAVVEVDGRRVGTTPWKGTLAAGRRRVSITSPGFVTARESVDLQAGNTLSRRFELQAERVTASVLFSANPGTEVHLDGVLLGTIPPVLEKEVRTGRHTVRYVMPGYAEHEETIQVEDRSGQEFSHQFPVPGSLRVTAQPYARVFLDGKDLGFTPARVEKVSEGEHVVTLERDGFHRIERRITVKAFEVNRFQFEMVREN